MVKTSTNRYFKKTSKMILITLFQIIFLNLAKVNKKTLNFLKNILRIIPNGIHIYLKLLSNKIRLKHLI